MYALSLLVSDPNTSFTSIESLSLFKASQNSGLIIKYCEIFWLPYPLCTQKSLRYGNGAVFAYSNNATASVPILSCVHLLGPFGPRLAIDFNRFLFCVIFPTLNNYITILCVNF